MLNKYKLNNFILYKNSFFKKNIEILFLYKLIFLEIYKYLYKLNFINKNCVFNTKIKEFYICRVYMQLINLLFNKNSFYIAIFSNKNFSSNNNYLNYLYNKVSVFNKFKRYSTKKKKSVFYRPVFFKKYSITGDADYSIFYKKYILNSYIFSNRNEHHAFSHKFIKMINIVNLNNRLKLNWKAKIIYYKNFKQIALSKLFFYPKEYKILKLFLKFNKKCFSKSEVSSKEFFKNAVSSISNQKPLSKLTYANSVFSSSRFYKNSFMLPYFYKFTSMTDFSFLKNQFFLKTKIKKNKNKQYLNTFLPVAFKASLSKNFYSSIKLQASPVYDKYIVFYVLNFLEFYVNQNIWIKVNSQDLIEKNIKSILKKVANKNINNQKSVGKELFIDEMYEIMWISFNTRNIEFFADWLKKLMEKIHLKKHKKVAKVIFSTLKKNKKLFFKFTGVVGFSFDIRGKLGVTGNAKKRHYSFTVGKISITSKKFPLYYYFNTVRTSTGVLGLSYYLMVSNSTKWARKIEKEN